MNFKNAQEAFEHYYELISKTGVDFDNTKTLFNQGFTILNPLDNNISSKYRKWNPIYAKREWDWYLSGNPNAEEISKYAPIWKKMMDLNNNVRSNYGWQWERNNQLQKVIEKLKKLLIVSPLILNSLPILIKISLSPISRPSIKYD